jgi:hypothetical protein
MTRAKSPGLWPGIVRFMRFLYSTALSQVWAELAPDSQRRAVQLLAQMALDFLTAQLRTAQKEDTVCLNSAITPS